MTALASFLLALAGFAAVAVSMVKHHRDLFGRPLALARKQALRIAGWALLAVSVVPLIIGQGASVGLTCWFGVAAVAANTVALALTYRPGKDAFARRPSQSSKP